MAGAAGAIRAGRAFVELFADDNKLYRALDRAKKAVQSWGGGLTAAGGGLAAAGAALAAPFALAVGQVRDLAKLSDVAAALGLTAEQATGLFAVFEAGGSDIRDATEGLLTLSGRVDDAVNGRGEEAVELFKQLGVNAKDFAGLDVSEQFFKLHAALRELPDQAQQARLLLKAVGEDTGKNMLRTLSMTAEQLRAAAGASALSGGDLAAAKDAERAYTAAAAAVSQVFRGAVVAVAPAVRLVAETVGAAALAARGWVRDNAPVIGVAAAAGAALVALGGALVALGAVLSSAGSVLGAVVAGVKGLAGAALLVLNPVGLIAAALAAGVALWATYTESGRATWQAIREAVGEFFGTFRQTWSAVSDALAAGDFAAAGDVAFAGLSLAWAQAVTQMQTVWVNFTRFMRDAFAVSKDAIVSAWATAVDFLADRIAKNFYDDAVAGQLSQIQAEERKLRERSLTEAVGGNAAAADASLEALRGREDAARARFDAARAKAVEDNLIAEWFRLLDAAPEAARLPRPGAGLLDEARGAFGGAARQGTFAFGEKRQGQQAIDIAKDQLAEQKTTNELLKKAAPVFL